MYDNELMNEENNQSIKHFKITNLNKIFFLIIIFILVLIIGFYIHNKNIKYYNSYTYIENKLEKKAREYVKTNNLQNSEEFYIEASKLNVELKESCHDISGVLIDGDNYQPYLLCSDYETEFNNYETEYIKLKGRNIMFLNRGNQYVEPYYEILSDVTVNVDSNIGDEEGVYEIGYVISKNNRVIDRLNRKVIVLDNEKINDFYPNILLIGEKIEYLELNSNYIEKGAKCFDAIDGIIDDITVSGEINVNQVGEYNLNYIAINSRGYATSITRKVVVISNEANISLNYITSPRDLTSENVLISLAIYGNDYDYTVLPNNEISYDKFIQHKVKENGDYQFKVYTKNGMFKEEIIIIKNIDIDKPKGVCSGYYLENKSYVTIDAEDSNGILKYVINGSSFRNNVITLEGETENIDVSIYDKAGNYNVISCQLEDRNPVTNACNDKTIYPGHMYSFTQTQKEKMAAMISTEADGNPHEAVDYLGMKLVASHMCNYYEKLYEGKEWTGDRLHHLITTSTWYAEMTKQSKFNANNERHKLALKAVEEVMEKGNRILPHYIDEFDMFPKDVRNPLSDRNAYVKDVTTYINSGGLRAVFWCINYIEEYNTGNIFGYTSKPSN